MCDRCDRVDKLLQEFVDFLDYSYPSDRLGGWDGYEERRELEAQIIAQAKVALREKKASE